MITININVTVVTILQYKYYKNINITVATMLQDKYLKKYYCYNINIIYCFQQEISYLHRSMGDLLHKREFPG